MKDELKELSYESNVVYKVGMTRRSVMTRFREYPEGSKLCFSIGSFGNEAQKLENFVKQSFPKKFKAGLGTERFEGSLEKMIEEIVKILE
jgi:hypothetical protein